MTKAVKIEQSWPAARVELWPLERIIPYDKNPRQHSTEQVDLIARSMMEDGVTAPILVDEAGVIIYGHGRRMGAEKNAFAQYPVVIARGWTEQKKRAYRIKDNSYALLSTWSPDLLRIELNELSLAGYEMPLLGFDDVQLVSFLSVPSGADPEATPEPPVKPISRPGDLWQLGKHRLLCGDSTKADAVERVLDGKKPHLMVTDPPYGVEYDPTWRDDAGGIFGDGKAKMRGLVQNDNRAGWKEAWDLFAGDVAYIWCASLTSDLAIIEIEAAGLKRRSQIIWRKPHFQLSRGDYHWQHEPCWYAVRPGRKSRWNGDRTQSTIWDIAGMNPAGRNRDEGNERTGHGTQKPVECMQRPIQNNSKPGDYVYEPFAGSGTTIIAAEVLNRYCLAIELAPNYVDVCVLRWQAFAKGEAILAGDGRTFAQVTKDRNKTKKVNGAKPAAPQKAPARSRAASPG